MPSFNFKFSSIVSKKKTITKNIIDTKNTEGLIVLDKNGEFYVISDNIKYPLTKKSYSCKGKNTYYDLSIDKNHLIQYNRNAIGIFPELPPIFTPFAPGHTVLGNIIIKDFKKYFDITKIILDNRSEQGIEILKDFIENSKLYKTARYGFIKSESKEK